MQKDSFIHRALQFAESKGFYMILGLCVVAIGVSTYVLFFTAPEQQPVTGVLTTEDPQAGASGQAPQVTVPKQPASEKPKTPSKPVKPADSETVRPPQTTVPKAPAATESKPVSAPVEEVPANAVEVNAKTTVKEPVFTLPIRSAEIQREYSGQELVPDPTMGDWRTHNGTDFVCDEGDEVMAVLDGVVAEIGPKGLLGTCVRVDHGAGTESLYCGVEAEPTLKVGQKVHAGQTIGRVGGSNLSESAQETHLHLEMTEDGVLADPMSILK